MGETLYTTLGVDADADVAAIRRAYREQVKERHPDVSDEPGAPREFKRLTTARDVLTDEDERDRYDRLGHDVYVRRNLDTSVWVVDDDGEATTSGPSGTGSGSQSSAASEGGASSRRRTRRHRRHPGREPQDRSAWLGDDHERRDGTTNGSGRARTDPGNGDWWEASEVYTRSSPTANPSSRSGNGGMVGLAVRVAPWLAIHLVLLASAVATGWFTYTRAEQILPSALPAAAVGVLLVGLVVVLSTLHLVSILYT